MNMTGRSCLPGIVIATVAAAKRQARLQHLLGSPMARGDGQARRRTCLKARPVSHDIFVELAVRPSPIRQTAGRTKFISMRPYSTIHRRLNQPSIIIGRSGYIGLRQPMIYPNIRGQLRNWVAKRTASITPKTVETTGLRLRKQALTTKRQPPPSEMANDRFFAADH